MPGACGAPNPDAVWETRIGVPLSLPLLTLIFACTADPPAADTAEPVDTATEPVAGNDYSASLGDAPDFSAPHSRVQVDWWLDYGSASLSGVFADGPPLALQTEQAQEGSCRVVGYTPSFCDPGCTDGDVCVDGTCLSYPERIDAGALDWTWPGGGTQIEADSLLSYWGSAELSQEGESSLKVGALTLTLPTVVPPEPEGSWDEAFAARDDAQDVTLRWSNPIAGARVRLHMTDCVGSHGGIAAAEIECEGPDSGSLVIPGVFVDTLAAGDWSRGECGAYRVERYHAASDPEDVGLRYESQAITSFYWRPDWE